MFLLFSLQNIDVTGISLEWMVKCIGDCKRYAVCHLDYLSTGMLDSDWSVAVFSGQLFPNIYCLP